MRWSFLLSVLALCGPVAMARAHFHMLLPDRPAAERDEEVGFTFQYGHPFEHELSDAERPTLAVILPDGKRADLGGTLEKGEVAGAEGRKAVVWRFRYKPTQRGDHVFLATAKGELTKVVLHVRTQNGWDASADGDVPELTPLTRPYGLDAGVAFQVRAATGGKGDAGVKVEFERYNPTPPKELPPDESITRVAKADLNGVATCTLPEAGWWCLSYERATPAGPRRGTFWVHVGGTPR